MEILKEINNNLNTKNVYLSFEEEYICPRCKITISPNFISGSLDTITSASIFNYCRNCNSTFITNYQCFIHNELPNKLELVATGIISSEPNTFYKENFEPEINKISNQFEKIYNQAFAAESTGLDEIAGLGYRKSLEFLIKDFAIHLHPDKEDEIKSKMLSKCINDYIDDSRIKTLATKSAWIGNDEAHYIRKQESRDVDDMKKFIKAALYFITMVLITEDAETIESK